MNGVGTMASGDPIVITRARIEPLIKKFAPLGRDERRGVRRQLRRRLAGRITIDHEQLTVLHGFPGARRFELTEIERPVAAAAHYRDVAKRDHRRRTRPPSTTSVSPVTKSARSTR